jgi:hypothetical protein
MGLNGVRMDALLSAAEGLGTQVIEAATAARLNALKFVCAALSVLAADVVDGRWDASLVNLAMLFKNASWVNFDVGQVVDASGPSFAWPLVDGRRSIAGWYSAEKTVEGRDDSPDEGRDELVDGQALLA